MIGERVMTMIEVQNRSIKLINKLLEVWEDSVKATYLFLSNEEINTEYKIIHKFIYENNTPIAFMGIEGKKLEMLFIKNSERGKGLGKQLLNYGIEKYDVNELTVNEQNPNAKGFYEHMEFKTYKRTEVTNKEIRIQFCI